MVSKKYLLYKQTYFKFHSLLHIVTVTKRAPLKLERFSRIGNPDELLYNLIATGAVPDTIPM